MGEQRGHGPTEQREWGEGWPRTVCADEGHRTELDVLRNRCEDCGGSFTELVPLSEAEAALSRVEGERDRAVARLDTYLLMAGGKELLTAEAERDELAAHLERVRERVWPYRSENEYDPGSTPGPPPDRYFEGVGDLADAVLSLLPDPKGER